MQSTRVKRLAEKGTMMNETIDIREISGCACMGARRIARQLTQIYDHALEPTGLTANQFGVLSQLYGAATGGRVSLSLGELAQRLGKHASTLNRDLKPLESIGLVVTVQDKSDRRVRAVTITGRGRSHLRTAVARWRDAEAQIRAKLGADGVADLKRAIGDASAALQADPAAARPTP